jgi:S1-C subfamily serine protease
LGKVTAVLDQAIRYLAARVEPLNFAGNTAISERRSGVSPAANRRAASGIVPDMAHRGVGIRVDRVQPESGAEAAGLKKGDTLLVIAGVKTPDLQALADALRSLHPGQTVDVEFARDGAIFHSMLLLGER